MWALREELGLDKDLISDIAKAQSSRERGDYGAIPSIKGEDLGLMEDLVKRLRRKLENGNP